MEKGCLSELVGSRRAWKPLSVERGIRFNAGGMRASAKAGLVVVKVVVRGAEGAHR